MGIRLPCGIVQLNKSAILSAAIGILQDYGLGDLTMRRLSTALSVAPGALYWHVPNKQALLGEVASYLVGGIPEQSESPQELCAGLWDAVVAVRDGAEIVVAAQAAGTVPHDVAGRLADFPGIGQHGGEMLVHYVLGAAWDLQTRAVVQQSLPTAQESGPDFHQARSAVLHGVEVILKGLSG